MPDEMNKREVILTIREYENSVAMPEGERVTYLDPRGGVHLKDGDDKALDYMGHAAKCAEYLRFGDEVDAVTCGEYPRSSAVKFCDTPELFVQAGFRPLPMLYTQRHLRDAIRPKSSYDPHRHGLTVEQMKRLPELVEHPVMLCDSPAREDTMLVVLRDVDCDDLPLIMAVRPDGRGYYEAGEIETNFILAVYGRTNFPRYFDNLITPDRVVYYDEERGRELNALAKLHLLRSHIVEPDLNRTIIRRPQCIVKSETAGQDGYRLESKAKEARDSSAKLAEEHGKHISRVHDKEGRYLPDMNELRMVVSAADSLSRHYIEMGSNPVTEEEALEFIEDCSKYPSYVIPGLDMPWEEYGPFGKVANDGRALEIINTLKRSSLATSLDDHPQGVSLKQAAMEAREASAKLFDKNVGADSPTRRDER